jgi:hypothetical protein
MQDASPNFLRCRVGGSLLDECCGYGERQVDHEP